MKSITPANEAILKIENPSEHPSEHQETQKQSNQHSPTDDLDFHKKALRSHDQLNSKSADVNFILATHLDTNER